MKKLVLLALLAVMALSVGVASAQEPITIVYWSMWNETEGQALAIQSWIEKFEAANPGVDIQAVWNGRQNQTLVRTALSGGTVIDLVDQDSDQIAGGLQKDGFALPLNDWLAQPALDHEEPLADVFLPGTLEMFAEDDGTIYQIPYIYNTVQFWYDKRVFEEVGVTPPQTWDEFLTTCDALRDAGYAPIAAEGNERFYSTFYLTNMVARMKGPGFLLETAGDPTGEMWRDPVYLQTSQMLRELWDRGCIPPETLGYVWPQGQNTLAFGQAAMSLVGSWLPVELNNAVDPEWQWGGFNFPSIEGGEGAATDVNALLLGFMVNKDTAHPETVLEFLRFIMTDENQKQMTDEAFVGVTNKYVEWNPIIADAAAAAQNATAMYPDVDGIYGSYIEYLNVVLGEVYSQLWQGLITPEQFVEEMVTQSKAYWDAHPQS